MNELIVTLAQGGESRPARKRAKRASKKAAKKNGKKTAEPDTGEQSSESD